MAERKVLYYLAKGSRIVEKVRGSQQITLSTEI